MNHLKNYDWILGKTWMFYKIKSYVGPLLVSRVWKLNTCGIEKL